MSEKKKKVEDFKAKLLKSFGKNSDVFLTDVDNIIINKIPTGSLNLDIALKGGYPRGTLVEIFGENQSGKTTASIEATRQFQLKYPDEMTLWLDLEKVFDPKYFRNIGVDLNEDKIIIMRGLTGEKAYDAMISFIESFEGGLIIVDSVPLLLPEKEDAGDMEDASMGSAGRLNSKGTRKLIPRLNNSDATVIFLNQIRDKIGVMFGDPTTTTGGRAIPYYTRTRIKVASEKVAGDETKQLMRAKIEKANYGMPKGTTVKTEINHGFGFNNLYDLVEQSVETGIITKSGSWYSYGETKLGQGSDGVIQLFESNPEFAEEVEKRVRAHYGI